MSIKIETDILPKLKKVKRDQNGWTACCPAHDDKNPSLAIAVKDKKILFTCFAGCSYKEIVQALGLFEREQPIKPKFGTGNTKQPKIVATYDYEDESGNPLYQSVRYEPKTFKIRRADGNGSWIWNLQGIKKVPYHLPELIQARENNLPVIICEGEKDVGNVREKLDFIATTTAQGSNAWNNDYTDFFDNLDVIILPDNDEPGKKYANDVAVSLWGIAKSVKIIQLPDLAEKGDVSDWIESGGTREKLIELENQTPEWNPDQMLEVKETSKEETNNSLDTFIIKSANEWIENAKNKPALKMLFGEFWHEGEICILFADTNLGKSILAVQIADSISNGQSMKPLILEAERQKVLYFDFELSDRQFISRYSEKNDLGNFVNPYQFDEKLLRVEINPDGNLANSFAEYEKSLTLAIQKAVEETGARILIIDNLTYLRSDNEKAKDALPLMKELKALKEKYNLSIMALAHTPKRDMTKPIIINDLQGSKMLGNFCDSVFAIGQSNKDSALRYLKQLKARQTAKVYHEENVCVGEVTKSGNFLKFEFLEFGNEREHLSSPSDNDRQELVRKAAELEQQGKTQREIASVLSVSLGKANSLLKTAKELNSFSADYVQTVHPLFDMEGVNTVNTNNDDNDTQNMKLPE